VAIGTCNELAWHSADMFVAKLSHTAKISYCRWGMTELRSLWKVGQSVVCNFALVRQFVYEIGVVVTCYVYRTFCTMITAIVITATVIASLIFICPCIVIFENMALLKIFGPKRDKVTEVW